MRCGSKSESEPGSHTTAAQTAAQKERRLAGKDERDGKEVRIDIYTLSSHIQRLDPRWPRLRIYQGTKSEILLL